MAGGSVSLFQLEGVVCPSLQRVEESVIWLGEDGIIKTGNKELNFRRFLIMVGGFHLHILVCSSPTMHMVDKGHE